MKTHNPYQPKTGQLCHCKPGIQRDNCSRCEGTGKVVDFAKIRAERKQLEAEYLRVQGAIDFNG